MSDTRATYEVFCAQIDKYDDLEKNIDFLSNFSKQKKNLDLAGFIYENSDGNPTFSFGTNFDFKLTIKHTTYLIRHTILYGIYESNC